MLYRSDLANALRFLSIDSIEKAKSGHPGMPLGMAEIAEVLWNDHLKHNPNNPYWINRDRFILSNGHGSMLHYALLHLSGYNLSITQIKNFRQLGYKTPGHPELGYTIGIETTTGPLGQGLANAIGMAISEHNLSKKFNKKNYKIINHKIWSFVGDGCLMEGISHESCSLAGNLGLGNLIVFYDDNNISIDGKSSNWFNDNTYKRFKSYNWHIIGPINGHNFKEINRAISISKKIKNKPKLIICKTLIGYGSPNKAGTSNCHGSFLGKKEIELVRKNLNWKYPAFKIPKNIYLSWNAQKKGIKLEEKYNKNFKIYSKKYPLLANEFKRIFKNKLPNYFNKKNEYNLIKKIQTKNENIASRQASQNILNILAPKLPELIGGSADLTPSNLTLWKNAKIIKKNNYSGNYLYYGVREFGMGAIANGIAIYGGFIVFDSTFLVFIEYMLNAIRMSALCKIKMIHIFTHDSIGLGEDGPTHQPIEQIEILRALPGLIIWRPADYTETVVSWLNAIKNKEPTVIILSRQNLITQKRNKKQLKNIKLGGYILYNTNKKVIPDLIFIATGSELNLVMETVKSLEKKYKNLNFRIVSMPSTSIYDKQNKNYHEKVLPKKVRKRIAVESASINNWYKYVGLDGYILGMKTYGASGKLEDLFKYFGFTKQNLIKISEKLLKKLPIYN
ncbi:Transketolase 1 [Candidatus Portiera aleyrodidarum]|uniref:transketolase n=1 Tax=Candidatus Portiera aleyrodidarum TaxID=91844 RepID=UPI0005D7A011|nr:transketolase [Candidatus Portiera aleyrodidarum]CEL12464.1 Transketolase 1 [Candidatus Portiera aleyrodidarum]